MAKQLTITLSDEVAERVRAKVASGKYASEEALVEQALDSFESVDEALDRFLRTEAQAICDRMDADPSRRIPFDQVLRDLELEDEEGASAAA